MRGAGPWAGVDLKIPAIAVTCRFLPGHRDLVEARLLPELEA